MWTLRTVLGLPTRAEGDTATQHHEDGAGDAQTERVAKVPPWFVLFDLHGVHNDTDEDHDNCGGANPEATVSISTSMGPKPALFYYL